MLTAAKTYLAGRRWSQPLWESVHRIALYGMNYGPARVHNSGEGWLLRRVAALTTGRNAVVVDVGANIGEYAEAILECWGSRAQLFCIEPAAEPFALLVSRVGTAARCERLALGDTEGSALLRVPVGHSALASLYRRDLPRAGVSEAREESVTVSTLDHFCSRHEIERVTLLKIDVEGAELTVLNGAARLLEREAIDIIQFEFGGTQVDARTFFRDFFNRLHPRFALFRLLRDGLRPIRTYDEHHEIFLTVNFVGIARRSELAKQLGV